MIPAIMQYKRESRTSSLRAWSAGCATGEEPYSLAILFQHALESEPDPRSWTLRITATDLDDKALEKAREGRYESAKVPTGLAIEDYFDREETNMWSKKGQAAGKVPAHGHRETPPCATWTSFCRNVLIYFEREKQQRILDIFRQCLRPGGFVLGKSEAILGPSEGPGPFQPEERVYRKEDTSSWTTAPGGRGQDDGMPRRVC